MSSLVITIFLLVLVVGIGVLLFYRSRLPKLSKKDLREAEKHLEKTLELRADHAVLEVHKIFIATLQLLYPEERLGAAQLVKKVADRFPNTESVWKYHRLRNRIAHQTEVKVFDEEAQAARESFLKALRSVTK